MRARPLQPKLLAPLAVTVAATAGLASCGTQGIQLAKSNPNYTGAKLFLEHCSGCHTLAVVGAEGSATSIKDRLRTNGPNFNFRKENTAQVLYAIRNGGFSGAIMPENIVVGPQAQQIASFLAKYSGLQAPKVPVIENTSFGGSSEATTPASSTSASGAPATPAMGANASASGSAAASTSGSAAGGTGATGGASAAGAAKSSAKKRPRHKAAAGTSTAASGK